MEPAEKHNSPDSSNDRSGVPTDALSASTSGSSGKRRRHSTAMLSGAILLVALLIVLAGSGVYYLMHRQHASPIAKSQAFITWKSRGIGLTRDDKQAIDDALVEAFNSGEPALSTSGYKGRSEFFVIDAERSGSWAIASVAVRMSPAAAVVATEPIFFIAQRHGASWFLTFTSSAHFCQRLHQLPSGLQGPTDNKYFGC